MVAPHGAGIKSATRSVAAECRGPWNHQRSNRRLNGPKTPFPRRMERNAPPRDA